MILLWLRESSIAVALASLLHLSPSVVHLGYIDWHNWARLTGMRRHRQSSWCFLWKRSNKHLK